LPGREGMYWKWAWRREHVDRVQSASGMTGFLIRPMVAAVVRFGWVRLERGWKKAGDGSESGSKMRMDYLRATQKANAKPRRYDNQGTR